MIDLLIYLILLPPFIGASLAWIGDKLWHQFSKFIGIVTIGISAISALISFVLVVSNDWDPVAWELTYWIGKSNKLVLLIQPDALGVFMATIAAFLGLLIAIFSLEYMNGDEHLSRYWFFIQLFIGGMILLVIAGDLVLMYVGWEIVGLCSFGLISHWYTKPGEEGEKCAKAGIKAFVFTRIGDIGFLVAVVIIYGRLGTLVFTEIEAKSGILKPQILTIVGLLFLMAAFGKSAQIPFIPWLSSPEDVDIDAMQGPTTVSALIHAATMVKAGIYLVSRLYLVLPLWNSNIFLWVLISFAGITSLITALSALASFDLKRILAYSTVSQLAYMFLALGMAYISLSNNEVELSKSSFLAAQFHLISHALFKSLLFLTAGYLIHKKGTRNILEMRGSAAMKNDRIAFLGFIVGGFSLIGLPPFNGFFSKEYIIGSALAGISKTDRAMALTAYSFGLITTLVTAMYILKLYFYLFTGDSSHQEHHSSSILMQVVIIILSILTMLGGLLQLILPKFFESIIQDGEFHSLTEDSLAISNTVMLSIAIVLILFFGWKLLISSPDIINKMESIFLIKWIVNAARTGFYLENIWYICWLSLKKLSYEFRRTHTGDLNYTMFSATIVSFVIIFFVVGG